MQNDQMIEQTKNWVEKIVIKHNFCPFAAKPFRQNKIAYAVSNATNETDLVDDLVNEIARLRDASTDGIETSLLIIPDCLNDFGEYNQFLDIVDAILEEMDLVGEIQVASFHPDYHFADLMPNDVRNYTNRSIFPMLHLIREDSIETARDTHPDVDSIPEKNMALLEEIGLSEIKKQISSIN